MLTRLHVQNFAIISDLTLDFSNGLAVFSGETGAGKSIFIEALGFLLGARGDVSVIKDGNERMCVSAEFTADDLPADLRETHHIAADRFTLRRELDKKAKGKAYVDGRPVTVSTLAQLGKYLVDFHGQHEHQSLLHTSVHLTLLDHFAKHDTLKQQISAAYTKEQEIRARLEALRLSAQEKERLLDLYSYQLKEIEEKLSFLKKSEDIKSLLEEIKKKKHDDISHLLDEIERRL